MAPVQRTDRMLVIAIYFALFAANSDTLFLATISAETIPSSTGERIIFDRDLINPGGHYNPQQGSYTAPFSGYYQ